MSPVQPLPGEPGCPALGTVHSLLVPYSWACEVGTRAGDHAGHSDDPASTLKDACSSRGRCQLQLHTHVPSQGCQPPVRAMQGQCKACALMARHTGTGRAGTAISRPSV